MKKTIYFLPVLFLLIAADKSKPDYSKLLPGVVKVTDDLYYDKTEITNISWLEYIYWNRKNDSTNLTEAFPDTNVWASGMAHNQPYVSYYLDHPAYRDYPVVGVSWQQANDYCQWRTARVKEYIQANNKQKKAPYNFVYRLPTKEEFNLMYSQIENLPNQIGEEGKKKYQGLMRYNMKREATDLSAEAGKLNDNADVTAPVISYWPNESGVYNIKGNVAEWLSEPNTYAGGAWNTPLSEDVSQTKTADEPSAAIGFRCVCEVLED